MRNFRGRDAYPLRRAETGRRNRSNPRAERRQLSSTVFQSPNELETRPGVVDCADFDVDQSRAKAIVANDTLVEIGCDTGCTLRPGDPEHPVRLQPVPQNGKLFHQLVQLLHEDNSEIESSVALDPRAVRNRSDQRRKIIRRGHKLDPCLGLDAQLLDERRAGVSKARYPSLAHRHLAVTLASSAAESRGAWALSKSLREIIPTTTRGCSRSTTGSLPTPSRTMWSAASRSVLSS